MQTDTEMVTVCERKTERETELIYTQKKKNSERMRDRVDKDR